MDDQGGQCFVCDEDIVRRDDENILLLSNSTRHSHTGLPTKIGQLMGDGFMVVVTACDEVCTRCFDLINYMDKLEVDLEKVRRLVTAYLRKKYGLLDAIKDEPLDYYDNTFGSTETSTKMLEEEVYESIYGNKNDVEASFSSSLDAGCKAAILEENTQICAMLRSALDAQDDTNVITEPKSAAMKMFKCKKCGLKFRTLKDYKTHEKAHTKVPVGKKRVLGCNICDFKTSLKAEFDDHIRKHVVLKPFKCDICNKRFESEKDLDQHVSSHNLYQCAECGAAYEHLEKLMVHVCVPQDEAEAQEAAYVSSEIIKLEQPESVSTAENKTEEDVENIERSTERDFDELCRATLQDESEYSSQPNQVSGKVTSEKSQMPISVEVSDFIESGKIEKDSGTLLSEFMVSKGEESREEEEIVEADGDEDYDENDEEDDEDDDDDDYDEDDDEGVGLNDGEEYIVEDEDDDDLDDAKPESSSKIYMEGVEVSFSDVVSNDDGLLGSQLVSAELGGDDSEVTNIGNQQEAKSGKRKVYVCSVCKFRTPHHSSIKKHLETHSITITLECEVCKMKLKTQRTYDKHMKRHLELPIPVECSVCKEVLPDKFIMRKHMTDSHPSIFKCQFCDEVCVSVRARRRHEASHSSGTSRTCDECGKTFRRATQLEVHKEYAHRDPKCRYCGKMFDKAVKLKEHERRHARDQEGFPCTQCDRVLKTASGLKLHRAKHTGQYKFCCDVCGRGFMSKAIMEEHMGRHTQEKRYTCDVCGKMFVFNSTMRIHRKWHDNPLPYKCKTCGQKFRHTSLLSVHRRRMHTGERPYKCPYCALSFTVSNCLKRHVVLHTGAYPYFCDPCSKGFTTKQKMAVHLAKVHNNRDMLNAKPPPCEYKMVLPNQPGQGPADSDDERSLSTAMEGVAHVEEVEHVIIQNEQQQLEAEGNIQLQIITMDSDHGFSVFE